MSIPAILINTCDTYLDVLEIQLELLEKHGYFDQSGLKVYVNTETKTLEKYSDHETVIFHKNGFKAWGERVRSSLKIIDSTYVLCLFDDYFPETNFDKNAYFDLLNAVSLKNMDCCYLAPLLKRKDKDSRSDYGLFRINDLRPYRLNSMAAVWSITTLLTVLKDHDDPWSWEAFGGYRPEARNLKIWSVSEASPFQYVYSFQSGGAVYRGGWAQSVLDRLGLMSHPIIMSSERPVHKTLESTSRSIVWKIKFLAKGFSISKSGVFKFIFSSIKAKYFG